MEHVSAAVDPAVDLMVRQAVGQLHTILDERSQTPSPPAPAHGGHSALSAARMRTALEALCHQGDLCNATPLALRLFADDAEDPRLAYLLGTCLQRQAQPELALTTYLHAAQTEGDGATPAPLLRAGECLLTLGRRDDALALFEAALRVARRSPAHAHLRCLAQAMVAALRAASRA